MTDQREAVIQVKGLKKNFGSLEVLKGVDMKVLKGEAVVSDRSESGSGKIHIAALLKPFRNTYRR